MVEKKIDKFFGEYRFLSNFFPASCMLDGIRYPTVEHAYQAAKTVEEDLKLIIGSATSAGKAKECGQRVSLREDWEDIKLEVMETCLRSKFRNPKMKYLLKQTGDAILEEGNTWGDTFWGICDGEGENHLGRLLMKIRKELQDGNNTD